MHVITQICVLFLWMHTVTFVTSQGKPCEKLDINNAYLIRNEKQSYNHGERVGYACRDDANRRFSIICELGVWTGVQMCEAIKCKVNQLEGTSHDPPYKNVFSPGETVRVTCDEKYWVSTPQEVSAVSTCQETGEWTFRPICREVTCPDRQPPNMDYWERRWQWSTPTLGATRRFTCRYGYKSAGGATSVTCTRDGWKPDPACQEITCDREDVPNTDIEGESKQEYKLGQRIRYICKDGYEGRFTRTCGVNGWIRDRFDGCRGKQCEKLDIINANLIPYEKQSYNHGERVEYACRDDSDRRFSITCELGVWTGVQMCEELLGCEPPPALDHGDIKYTMKSQYNHNEMVEYMCQLYHTMEGEPNRICINGEWTGHMRCLKPCILKEDDTRQHNITLKLSDKKFFLHDEIMEFECAHGVPVGDMAMRLRCNSGVVLLPTCQ